MIICAVLVTCRFTSSCLTPRVYTQNLPPFTCVYIHLLYMPSDKADVSFNGDHLWEWRCANQEIQGWVEEVRAATKCKVVADGPDKEKLMKLNKEALVALIMNGYSVTKSYENVFDRFQCDVENLKTDVIESQKKIIQAHEQLLEVQSQNLDSVKRTVKTVVGDTVQSEIKLYSRVVSESAAKAAPPSLTKDDFKSVVKSVVAEGDRSKNVVIFGLPDLEQEDLTSSVTEVFHQIGEKPKFEAARIGNRSPEKCRPVKVSVSSTSAVHQILVKSKELRKSEKFRRVFIDLDRNPEERQQQKELVQTMREMAAKCKDKRFYIRNGKICSADGRTGS